MRVAVHILVFTSFIFSSGKSVEKVGKKDAITCVKNELKPKTKKMRMKEKSMKWKEKMENIKKG